MGKVICLTLLVAVLLLAGCGGDVPPTTVDEDIVLTGDAGRGEELYNQTAVGAASAPGCVTCHSLEAGVKLVGPSHAGIAVAAGTRASGQSAEEYLRASIVDPDAAITEGYSEGVMYKNYGKDLSNQEIADLVAFLLTLQ